jgi:hypothetical protein
MDRAEEAMRIAQRRQQGGDAFEVVLVPPALQAVQASRAC